MTLFWLLHAHSEAFDHLGTNNHKGAQFAVLTAQGTANAVSPDMPRNFWTDAPGMRSAPCL